MGPGNASSGMTMTGCLCESSGLSGAVVPRDWVLYNPDLSRQVTGKAVAFTGSKTLVPLVFFVGHPL